MYLYLERYKRKLVELKPGLGAKNAVWIYVRTVSFYLVIIIQGCTQVLPAWTCTGCVICIWTIFESGFGIQVSQATPTKFSMLFKHNYGKLFWKFGDHSLNFSFVHGPSWLRILESIHRYGVIFTFCNIFSKGHCEAMLDVKKIYFIDF